jgi:hypothetical protein
MRDLITKTNNTIDEPLVIKKLREEIKEKEILLLDFTEKIDQLKIDLVVIKQEYNIKVGRLYLQLDQLDLDITKLLQIRKLISQGYTLKEAQEILNTQTKDEQEKINKQNESIDEDTEEQKSTHELSDEEESELKILYKKLVKKFHPDLALDLNEKKEREIKMQKINEAYKQKDLEQLKYLEKHYGHSPDQEYSFESLKQLLDEINKAISRLENDYDELTKTEWFEFKTRLKSARKNKRDLFAELEEKILKDIAQKKTKQTELSSLINEN